MKAQMRPRLRKGSYRHQPRGTEMAKAKLTDADVERMRLLFDIGACSITVLSRRYGVSGETARRAVRGLTWVHVTAPPVPIKR